jgi:hypothetical protein
MRVYQFRHVGKQPFGALGSTEARIITVGAGFGQWQFCRPDELPARLEKNGANEKTRQTDEGLPRFLYCYSVDGAHGGTRTPTPYGTWTWTMRVYQFRHVGILAATAGIISAWRVLRQMNFRSLLHIDSCSAFLVFSLRCLREKRVYINIAKCQLTGAIIFKVACVR